jgi:hypothetical protein
MISGTLTLLDRLTDGVANTAAQQIMVGLVQAPSLLEPYCVGA